MSLLLKLTLETSDREETEMNSEKLQYKEYKTTSLGCRKESRCCCGATLLAPVDKYE